MIKGLWQKENCFPSPRWSTRPTQLSLAKQLVFATASRGNTKYFPFFIQYWFFLPEEKSSTINRKTICTKIVYNFKITKLIEKESLESASNYQPVSIIWQQSEVDGNSIPQLFSPQIKSPMQ